VLASPVDPIEHWVYDYRLPIEDGSDKLTLGVGFGIDDDYLLVDGVSRVDSKANYDAMDIKEFAAAGRVFLAPHTNCTILERQGFVHHNLVTVTSDGQAELPPPVGELVHTAELGGSGTLMHGWPPTSTQRMTVASSGNRTAGSSSATVSKPTGRGTTRYSATGACRGKAEKTTDATVPR